MKILESRWETPVGKILRNKILQALEKGKLLEKITGIEKHLDYWDLRGIKFPNPKIKSTDAGTSKYDNVLNNFKLKNINLQKIDFSYAILNYLSLISCTISDCKFDNTTATNLDVIACNFENITFLKTNFKNSFLNLNIGSNSGSFIKINFDNVNLSKCSFRFPIMDSCSFTNCNLTETNFDGSRFNNCKFSGVIQSTFFRGYSIYASTSFLWVFNKVDPKKFPNKMKCVDFSDAKLRGVSFTHEINLSGCKFPSDDNYIIIKNLKKVYTEIQLIIESNWSGEDKRKGLALLKNLYFSTERQNQDMDLVEKSIMIDDDGSHDFGNQLFELIKQVNIKYNT